jgi:two-component system, OmpR family, response regulator RstA
MQGRGGQMALLGEHCMMKRAEPTTLLLVEDDEKLARLVHTFLSQHGFSLTTETQGDRAVERILTERPQGVILDLMLPGLDGFEVCRRIRPRYHGPLLMLTARSAEIDEIIGIELGADDYLMKPVRPMVLLTRLKALLRRTAPCLPEAPAPEARSEERIVLGSLVIDGANRYVQHQGKTVELTTAEFDLLRYLASHCGQVVPREQLFTEIRGVPFNGADRSMDLRIVRLRKKLGDDGKSPHLIKSIHGVGYLMVTWV